MMTSFIVSLLPSWPNSQSLTLDLSLVILRLWVSMASSGLVEKNLKHLAVLLGSVVINEALWCHRCCQLY